MSDIILNLTYQLSKETENAMITWLEAHPYKFYGDYRDQLSLEHVEMIIAGKRDQFWEAWWECTIDADHYADWSDIEDDFAEAFELIDTDGGTLEYDFWPEPIQQVFDDNKCTNHDDVLDTCLKNTRVHVTATPLKRCGEEIHFPHCFNDDDYNRLLQRYCREGLGMRNGWNVEAMYTYDALKVMGTIDLEQWLTKGPPDKISFTPDDQFVVHNGFNGSGGIGVIEISRSRTMPAEFRLDTNRRYGVQSVFGFVSSAWQNELQCVWSQGGRS